MEHFRFRIKNEIVRVVVSLPGLTDTSRIDQIKLTILQGQGTGGGKGGKDLSPFILDPHPLHVGMPEKTDANGRILFVEKIEHPLRLECVEDIRLHILRRSMAQKISGEKDPPAGKTFQISPVFVCQLSVGVVKGLVSKYIEALCRRRFKNCQIVISQNGFYAVLPRQQQAFPRISVVADDVSQLDHMIDTIGFDLIENRLKGFKIPVNIR